MNEFIEVTQEQHVATVVLNRPEAYNAFNLEMITGLADQLTLRLLGDRDNFYGYFLFQMSRAIRFDISSPTAVNFNGSAYVLHFNPVIFLTLTPQQMETTIKHEILHVCSLHLFRARELKASYSPLALNTAMDIVVNTHLDFLPPYAMTLERANLIYSLQMCLRSLMFR